jgi:hypothetical protein
MAAKDRAAKAGCVAIRPHAGSDPDAIQTHRAPGSRRTHASAPTRHLEPSPAESTGSLLDQLVAAENARDARDGAPDEPPERFQPARAPEPAPEPPDPEQAWADKITASIQAIADEAKADADRRHREAQAELEALLGIPGERAPRAAPGGARKSGAVDAKYSRY